MNLAVVSRVCINHRVTSKNGLPVVTLDSNTDVVPEAVYRQLGCNYPKFFKMDVLSKWAWVAAEILLQKEDGFLYDGLEKEKIAVVMATAHGCLEADKKYQQTLSEIPSPALFVYTLPNIMLGELCIRHGFKGEQICLVSEAIDCEALYFWSDDFLQRRGMDACLCGWVDISEGNNEVIFLWVAKQNGGIRFSQPALQQAYEETKK